jgi:clan AA aspartic protease
MGLVHANITLRNGEDVMALRKRKITEADVRSIDVKVLVDSGAIIMAINETIKAQLGLETFEKDFAQMADGSTAELDMVWPVEVRFGNRKALVEAFVLPGDSEPLLGAIPMERMDVLVDMARQELIINPLHPNRPQFSMKSMVDKG